MAYAISAFVICFLLIVSGLLLLFARDTLRQRLAKVLPSQAEETLWDRLNLMQRTADLGAFTASIGAPSVTAAGEPSMMRRKLTLAGLRRDVHLNLFNASKLLVPAGLCAITVITGLYQWNPFLVIVGAVGVGYLLPDYWLDARIKGRAENLRSGLPDLLDLMVVCLEAGLSLDQAALRSSEELRFAHPEIADELGLVMLEVRAGQSRMEAWRRMTVRSGEESIRLFVSVLIQADQFGTGVSKTLRVHADSLRVRRRQQVEELAHKTTVKLVFPLVLFIFPSFFITVLGPAIILVSESFDKF